jgi:hypothetical protein
MTGQLDNVQDDSDAEAARPTISRLVKSVKSAPAVIEWPPIVFTPDQP